MSSDQVQKTKHIRMKGVLDKVTGDCLFTSDLNFPDTLVAKGLYPPHARARIIRLDTSAAEKIPGVLAVATHHDLSGSKRFGAEIEDQPVFAIDEICYIGDMVAAVAAVDEATAQLGLQAINVEYEPIPGIFDPVAAIEADAILARADLESNILAHHPITHGDVENAFNEAAAKISGTFRTQCMEHLFLETESVIANWDGSQLTLYVSGQHPHGDQRFVASALGLSDDQVRVIYPYVGGGFGGKEDMHIQIHTASLAIKAGRPVKMVRTRDESFFTHTKRPAIETRVELSAEADGTLSGIRLQIVGDSGPYTNLSSFVMQFAAEMGCGPYKIPNAQIDSYCVATNNLMTGAFRGFGGPEVAYATEQAVDMLAAELGIDPLELRRKNAMEKGTLMPTGALIAAEIGLKDTIIQAAEAAHWADRAEWLDKAPAPHLRRGIGMASIYHESAMGRKYEDSAGAIVEVNANGTVLVYSGSAELGQGAFTTQSVIAAKVLGVDPNDVEIVMPDTDVTLDASVTSSSRATYMVGNAVLDAAQKVRAELQEVAAMLLEVDADEIEFGEGCAWSRNEPQTTLDLARIASDAILSGRTLKKDGSFRMWHAPGLPEGVEFPYPHNVFSYATQIAQVLVDTGTGHVVVEKIWAAHDVGKAINWEGIKGQIDGGVMMGVGTALSEHLIQKDGHLVNTSLSGYIAPMVTEIPEIDYIIIEVPEPTGPFGARGVGEPATSPVAPAIANAVADALGVRLNEIPMTPDRVWSAIHVE
jgi:CO/xanthine dehydrogenase Mo-binding subunit